MMCRTHFGPSLLVCNARVSKELVVHFIYSTLYNVLLKKVWKEHIQIAYPISTIEGVYILEFQINKFIILAVFLWQSLVIL